MDSEIRAGDELLLSELIFNGVFNSLTPELLVSKLVFCVQFHTLPAIY